MSAGIRNRMIAFLVLSAVGIVYVGSSYLGLVDKVLGRGYTVHATLPESGGLYEGSEVTYRGVKVGEVVRMTATEQGVTLDLAMDEGSRIPLGSPLYVHNLTAVGEQYLDFEPRTEDGPYAREGDTFTGGADSLPVGEDDLVLQLNRFVNSVDHDNLRTVIKELGLAFRDTGGPLEKLLDHGTTFIDEAAAHEDETVALLDNGLAVLQTQQEEGDNIRRLVRDLALITGSLKRADRDLRAVLEQTPGAVREVQALLLDLEPTLPILLGNMVSVDQVVVANLAGVEQLLVTFPRVVSSGFTGTPADGWGRVNLQFDDSPAPCTEGYLPSSEWRRGDEVTDSEIYPARCASGAPYNMRGTKYAPGGSPSGRTTHAGYYDPSTGWVDGAVDSQGRAIRFGDQGDLSILGGDAWKWLLIGPVADE